MTRFTNTILHKFLIRKIKKIAREVKDKDILERHLRVIYYKQILQLPVEDTARRTGFSPDNVKWILKRYKFLDKDIQDYIKKTPTDKLEAEFRKLLDILN